MKREETNSKKIDKSKKVTIALRPYKCSECDSAFCEFFLWCKGRNVEDD